MNVRKSATHARLGTLARRDGELLVNGIPLSRLAERVGQTPFYAYDRSLIAARVAAVRAALPARVSLHYAIKANPMPAVVGCLRELVDGFDVASHGEMLVALDAGMPAREVSFAGPAKQIAELRAAIAAGITINCESETELDRIRIDYNTVRLHEAIGYVTPHDEHHGQGEAIREARRQGLTRARQTRLEHNRRTTTNKPEETP